MTSPRPSSLDAALYYELDALRALAARVINEHANHRGACRACGRAFPCTRACLAEHNLQVCGDLGSQTAHPDRR
jgi:rRNA maturation endonuclease Nob1